MLPLLRKRRGAIIALSLGFLTLCSGAAKADDFFFRDGDQPIIFLGDSITEQRMYTTLIESYILTRFPNWKVTFRNVGWGGDTAYLARRGSFEEGLKRDVLSLKPSAVTVDYGMNDLRGTENNYNNYVNNSKRLVEQLKVAGIRVAVISPSPEENYQPNQPAGSVYNLSLARGTQALKGIAAEAGVPFVDQHTPFVQTIEAGRKAGVLGATTLPRLTNDSIHPNWAGHLVMADAILRGLNAPSLVSSAEIDATAKVVSATEACKIENLQSNNGILSFSRSDEALPLPIPTFALLALKIPDFTPLDDLSRYTLKVSNLTAPKYQILVDGKQAAAVTKEELSAGINLTLQAGAVTEQASKLLAAVTEKNELYFNRWRNVQIYDIPAWLQTPDSEARRKAELARMDAQIAEKEAALNVLRQPTPHTWSLKPIP